MDWILSFRSRDLNHITGNWLTADTRPAVTLIWCCFVILSPSEVTNLVIKVTFGDQESRASITWVRRVWRRSHGVGGKYKVAKDTADIFDAFHFKVQARTLEFYNPNSDTFNMLSLRLGNRLKGNTKSSKTTLWVRPDVFLLLSNRMRKWFCKRSKITDEHEELIRCDWPCHLKKFLPRPSKHEDKAFKSPEVQLLLIFFYCRFTFACSHILDVPTRSMYYVSFFFLSF